MGAHLGLRAAVSGVRWDAHRARAAARERRVRCADRNASRFFHFFLFARQNPGDAKQVSKPPPQFFSMRRPTRHNAKQLSKPARWCLLLVVLNLIMGSVFVFMVFGPAANDDDDSATQPDQSSTNDEAAAFVDAAGDKPASALLMSDNDIGSYNEVAQANDQQQQGPDPVQEARKTKTKKKKKKKKAATDADGRMLWGLQ